MRHLLVALLLSAASPLVQALEELQLLAEQPVDGMPQGNLSGLAWCGEALWAVSDREDDRLYRLEGSGNSAWQARAEAFEAPAAPPSGLPWGLRMRNWANGQVRGGQLDFEDLSCDAAGTRYLVSETRAAVLRLPLAGSPGWLVLPANLTRQARANGLLLQFNAAFEGLALDPAGERLWLVAERERRGLLALQRQQTTWGCSGGCVLLSEGGVESLPGAPQGQALARDFSALVFFGERLFTLERQGQRICRRSPDGSVERCWSFAAEAASAARRYDQPYGMAEGLWLDEQGAWIGLDNGGLARGDG
ncbi:MAG TPA: esterase-like activity of phytase family protein, partial [Pseudomonas sp.]|nr:esterase-like activity of phytase family protein [Pseudomonas sp.]